MACVKRVKLEDLTCAVCIEPFAYDSFMQSVECEHCSYTTCRGCLLRYVQEQSTVAQCMQCLQPFTEKFKVMFQIDDSAILKEELLKTELNLLPLSMAVAQKTQEVDEIVAERAAIKLRMAELVNKDKELKKKYTTKLKEPVKLLDKMTDRKCFAPECSGFLTTAIDGQLSCIICHRALCTACRDECVNDEHVCSEESLDTVALILKESVACPWCFIQVEKVADCNDIFCTICKKGFNYRTGQKIYGAFHNPYQHMLDVGNPDEIYYRVDLNRLKNLLGRNHHYLTSLSNLDLLLNKLNRLIDRLSASQTTLSNNETLRVNLILKRITAEQLGDELVSRHTRLRQISSEMSGYQTLRDVVYNELYRLHLICRYQDKSSFSDLLKAIDVCLENCRYAQLDCNHILEEVSILYKEVVLYVNDDFTYKTREYKSMDNCFSCGEKAVIECSCEKLMCLKCHQQHDLECQDGLDDDIE